MVDLWIQYWNEKPINWGRTGATALCMGLQGCVTNAIIAASATIFGPLGATIGGCLGGLIGALLWFVCSYKMCLQSSLNFCDALVAAASTVLGCIAGNLGQSSGFNVGDEVMKGLKNFFSEEIFGLMFWAGLDVGLAGGACQGLAEVFS